MNEEDNNMSVVRLVAYRLPANTPVDEVPPQPRSCRSKSFIRLVRYRPNITAKRKILWTMDSVLLDNLFMVYTKFDGEYTNSLCRWSPEIKDFKDYRDVFKSRSRVDYIDLVNSKLIIPEYIRVSGYEFNNKLIRYNNLGMCKLPLPPGKDKIDKKTNISDYVSDSSGCWVPTFYNNNEGCQVVLEGAFWLRAKRGLHNKAYIENDEELSQHERLRIMRSLVANGWITK